MSSRLIARSFLLPILLASVIASAQSSGPRLTSLDGPSGGHVVYGIFDQESSMQGAMAAMLRKVHSNFSDRPQIGQFFESKDGQTVGTFFTVNARNQGNKPIAGLILVTMPSGLKPSAAVLYDDAAHFQTSRPQLMKTLLASVTGRPDSQENVSLSGRQTSAGSSHGSYQASGASSGSNQRSASSASASPLRTVSAPDRSAAVSLPAGWRVTGGGGGMIEAQGPRDEAIHFGMVYNVIDPNTPMGRQTMQYARGSQSVIACSASRDLSALYQCVVQQAHRRRFAGFKVLSYKDLGAKQYSRQNASVVANVDFGDGRGMRRSRIDMAVVAAPGGNSYALDLSSFDLPENLADQEWATLEAVGLSFNQNSAVLQGQTSVALANQKSSFEAEQGMHRAQEAQGDAYVQNYNQRSDVQDRQSKSFQNGTFDRSILQDSDENARGTVSNNTADAFVRANPGRYQIVPQKDWIKGLDY